MQTQSATFDRLSNQDRDRDHQETHHRGQRQRETGKCKWQTIRKFQERGDPPRVRVQFKTTTRTRRPTASASTIQDNDKNKETHRECEYNSRQRQERGDPPRVRVQFKTTTRTRTPHLQRTAVASATQVKSRPTKKRPHVPTNKKATSEVPQDHQQQDQQEGPRANPQDARVEMHTAYKMQEVVCQRVPSPSDQGREELFTTTDASQETDHQEGPSSH